MASNPTGLRYDADARRKEAARMQKEAEDKQTEIDNLQRQIDEAEKTIKQARRSKESLEKHPTRSPSRLLLEIERIHKEAETFEQQAIQWEKEQKEENQLQG